MSVWCMKCFNKMFILLYKNRIFLNFYKYMCIVNVKYFYNDYCDCINIFIILYLDLMCIE